MTEYKFTIIRQEKLRKDTVFDRISKLGAKGTVSDVMQEGEFFTACYEIKLVNVLECDFDQSKLIKNAVSAYVLLNGLTGDLAIDEKALTKFCKSYVKTKNILIQIDNAICTYEYEDKMFIWRTEKELYKEKNKSNLIEK